MLIQVDTYAMRTKTSCNKTHVGHSNSFFTELMIYFTCKTKIQNLEHINRHIQHTAQNLRIFSSEKDAAVTYYGTYIIRFAHTEITMSRARRLEKGKTSYIKHRLWLFKQFVYTVLYLLHSLCKTSYKTKRKLIVPQHIIVSEVSSNNQTCA